jgi:hypothetical protein
MQLNMTVVLLVMMMMMVFHSDVPGCKNICGFCDIQYKYPQDKIIFRLYEYF